MSFLVKLLVYVLGSASVDEMSKTVGHIMDNSVSDSRLLVPLLWSLQLD